ncbi:hypothetical protein ABTL47_19955, partial [Acinetobacter baumannii]
DMFDDMKSLPPYADIFKRTDGLHHGTQSSSLIPEFTRDLPLGRQRIPVDHQLLSSGISGGAYFVKVYVDGHGKKAQ